MKAYSILNYDSIEFNSKKRSKKELNSGILFSSKLT